MSEIYVFVFMVGAVLSYGIHAFFSDREKARQHEHKLTLNVCASVEKLLPLDEHVRTNLDNFKHCLVESLKEQRSIVKGLDVENKTVTGKATAKGLLGRMPQP
jgi:hypothetical protein